MTDAVMIIKAARLGYQFSVDEGGHHWWLLGSKAEGPFETLDDAAYAAVAHHEIGEQNAQDA